MAFVCLFLGNTGNGAGPYLQGLFQCPRAGSAMHT